MCWNTKFCADWGISDEVVEAIGRWSPRSSEEYSRTWKVAGFRHTRSEPIAAGSLLVQSAPGFRVGLPNLACEPRRHSPSTRDITTIRRITYVAIPKQTFRQKQQPVEWLPQHICRRLQGCMQSSKIRGIIASAGIPLSKRDEAAVNINDSLKRACRRSPRCARWLKLTFSNGKHDRGDCRQIG